MRRLPPTLIALLAFAAPAHAHLMTTGFGPFYDGLTHVFVTPEDLLQVIAVALLAGLGGAPSSRLALLALPTAWLAGNVGGALGLPCTTPFATTAAATILVGGLVAADVPLPPAAVAGIAAAVGLVGGARNGIEVATAAASPLVGVGAACALFVLVSLLGGQVSSVRAPWGRVVVRVGGSWIAAIGLLMLGWSFRTA
jgi:urease accessory protein